KCGEKVARKKQSALSSQHSAKEGPCSRERSKIGCSYYSLGLWPQEIWAEQIPPCYSRADDHPITRKTKSARAGGPDSNALSLYARSEWQVVRSSKGPGQRWR